MSAQNPMDKKKFLQMMNITVEQLTVQPKKENWNNWQTDRKN